MARNSNRPRPIDSLGEAAESAVIAAIEQHITPEMSAEEQRALTDRLLDAAKRAMTETILESGPEIANKVEANFPRVLKSRRGLQRRFARAIQRDWGDALDYLEGLLHAYLEFGEAYFQELHHPDLQPISRLGWALAQLHARSCRVALEILTLLRAGLADGAHARWRTLHELAVVALVLQEGGDDMAEKYLQHKHVADWNVARNLQQHVHLLGWEPTPEADMAALKAAVDRLTALHGSAFAGDYGWATGVNGAKNPTLADLEASVDASRWRPIAKWANDAVHSGPRGLGGIASDLVDPEFGTLAAGATNLGIEDPGQNTALTLQMLTTALAANRPTGVRSAMLHAFAMMAECAQRAFIAAGQRLSARLEQDVGSVTTQG